MGEIELYPFLMGIKLGIFNFYILGPNTYGIGHITDKDGHRINSLESAEGQYKAGSGYDLIPLRHIGIGVGHMELNLPILNIIRNQAYPFPEGGAQL
jgi:hypothetical protein